MLLLIVGTAEAGEEVANGGAQALVSGVRLLSVGGSCLIGAGGVWQGVKSKMQGSNTPSTIYRFIMIAATTARSVGDGFSIELLG
jgi:hypothetical protein